MKKVIDGLLNGGILLGTLNQVELIGKEDPTIVVKATKLKGEEEEEGFPFKVEIVTKYEEDENK